MANRSWQSLVLVALSFLTASPVLGQEPPAAEPPSMCSSGLRSIGIAFHTHPSYVSYVEFPSPAKEIEPATILRDRLDRARGLAKTGEFLRNMLKDPQKFGLDPATMRDLQRDHPHFSGMEGLDLNDKNVQVLLRQAQQFLHDHPEFAGSLQGDHARIADTLKHLQGGGLKLESPPGHGTADTPPVKPEGRAPSIPRGAELHEAPIPGSNDAPPPASEAPDTGEHELDAQLARWLLKQLDQVQGADGLLKNSPEVQEAMNDLVKYLAEARGNEGQATDHASGPLSGLFRAVLQKGPWSKLTLPEIGKLPVPTLPRTELPRLGWSLPALPSLGMPNVGTPSMPTQSTGLVLLQVAVVAAAAVVLWKLFRRSSGGRAGQERRSWQLGPWPVDPRTVSTRADVIQAFEYLSLLQLGPESRSWNHLAIAAGLGDHGTERRLAAERLAALYEQARYAPGSDPLPADALGTARRELSFLARVGPA